MIEGLSFRRPVVLARAACVSACVTVVDQGGELGDRRVEGAVGLLQRRRATPRRVPQSDDFDRSARVVHLVIEKVLRSAEEEPPDSYHVVIAGARLRVAAQELKSFSNLCPENCGA